MANSISSVTTGTGGIVLESVDTSGNTNIKSGTTTIVAVSSTGAAVTGTLSASGAITGTSFAGALNGTLGATTPSTVVATTGTFNSTVTAVQYSSDLSGTTASLAGGASATILTVSAYQVYLVYGGGTGNTSAMGIGLAQANGAGTVTVTQLSGASTGFTLNASGSDIQITNNTATQAYRWKAVRLINLNA